MILDWSEVQRIIAENTPGTALEKLRELEAQTSIQIADMVAFRDRVSHRISNLAAALGHEPEPVSRTAAARATQSEETPLTTAELHARVVQVLAQESGYLTPTEISNRISGNYYTKIRNLVLEGRKGYPALAQDERFEVTGEERSYKIRMRKEARVAMQETGQTQAT